MQPLFIHPHRSRFLSSETILAVLTGLSPADPYLSQYTLPQTSHSIPPVEVSPLLSRGTDDFLYPAGSIAADTAKHNVCLSSQCTAVDSAPFLFCENSQIILEELQPNHIPILSFIQVNTPSEV